MADITIRIRDKVATVVGTPAPVIVCGNSGYKAVFDLDEEWSSYELLTMRVSWTDTFSGQPRHTDVPYLALYGFAEIPTIADAYEVSIGLYAGNLSTSTGARIQCERCVTDGGTYHEDPDPQTYAALLELLGKLGGGGASAGDATFILEGVNTAFVTNQLVFQEVTP